MVDERKMRSILVHEMNGTEMTNIFNEHYEQNDQPDQYLPSLSYFTDLFK